MKFKTNLVYTTDASEWGGLKCLGELEGVTQEVEVFERKVISDPDASGLGIFRADTLVKVYPGSIDYQKTN